MEIDKFFAASSELNCLFSVVERLRGVVLPRTRDRVCIFGAAGPPEGIPWEDARYEIWGCNALWHRAVSLRNQFRADRWFELHPKSVQSGSDLAWLSECPIPVYTLRDSTDWVPHYIKYPIEAVVPLGRRYFSNTFAYQVALAIYEGFHTIKLCNIWLEGGRELAVERACLEYWIGVATGRGIVIDIPDTSPLLTHPYQYGYDYWAEKVWVEKMLQERLTSFASDGFGGSK